MPVGGVGRGRVVGAAIAVVDGVGGHDEGAPPGAQDVLGLEGLALAGDRVAGLQADHGRHAGRAGRAVVRLRVADRVDAQEGRADVRGQVRWLGKAVVIRVRSGQHDPADRDGLVIANILIRGAGRVSGCIETDGVTALDATQRGRVEVHGDRRRAVIEPADRDGSIKREPTQGDVGGQTGRLRERVVAGIGAAERDAGDRDGLARADVLVDEAGRIGRAVDRDHVGADDADQARAAEVDGRGGVAVVDLVLGDRARDGQVLGRDRLWDRGRARTRVELDGAT